MITQRMGVQLELPLRSLPKAHILHASAPCVIRNIERLAMDPPALGRNSKYAHFLNPHLYISVILCDVEEQDPHTVERPFFQ